MRKTTSGFTIVELLIVIVVIGILAAITIVAYIGVQNRARAAAFASGIKKVDKAFHLKATSDSATTWWIDNTLTGTSNPTIGAVIGSTNPKRLLTKYTYNIWNKPKIGYYDNDGDTF